MNRTTALRNRLGRIPLVLLLATALVTVLAMPASAAIGYTSPGAGQMTFDVTCKTNSYRVYTPASITIAGRAYMERGYGTQSIGLEVWYYRYESNAWSKKWLGSATADGYTNVSFLYDWAPPYHGTYRVVGRFYYQRLDGTWATWDLDDDLYGNQWNGLDLAATRGSCKI